MTTAFAPYALRQDDLLTLSQTLKSIRTRAFDVVVPASKIDLQGTDILLQGIEEPVLFDDGVTDVNGLYSPTNVAEEGIAAKLDIDLKFLRRCRTWAPDVYQVAVKKFLDLDGQIQASIKETRSERSFLLRCLRADDSTQGLVRAFLSSSYKAIDNLDVLLAVLKGIQDAGIDDPIIDADLTERRMIVRVVVPQVAVYAEDFLKDYRNPFTGEQELRGWTPQRLREAAAREGHEAIEKVVFAGFVTVNSEVGGSRFRLIPRIVIGACTNGLQLVAEAMSKTHLGAQMDEGIVQWSAETQETNLRLITSQATDTVRTFLDTSFVKDQVDKLTEKAVTPVKDPKVLVQSVSKRLGFTQAQSDLILEHFIRGGQMTAGGVAQAVTSAAQLMRDGDAAYDMESSALQALDLVAAAS